MNAVTVGYWMGRPLEALSKEELIGAILILTRAAEATRIEHRRQLSVLCGAPELKNADHWDTEECQIRISKD